MTTKKQLLKAHAFIQAKQYQNARDILQAIEHTAAQKWLEKLDDMDTAMTLADADGGFGGTLAFGGTVTGTLSANLPLQDWRFTAHAGDVIKITMRSGEFDSLLELYDAEGGFLFEDDDSAGELDAQIVFTIPQDGSYIVSATECWSELSVIGGKYALTLERQ